MRVVKRWFGLVVAALVLAGLVVPAVPAAASTPISLLVSQSSAFGYLGRSCGGIQEQAFATGFDPVSGLPDGAVYLQTRCGGSGRGGGYHVTTYSAWITVTWDFTGAVVSSARTTAPTVDPAFSTTDASGNQLQNVLSATNVAPSACAVGNTTYCGYRAYLTVSPTYVPVPRLTAVSVAVGPASGGTAVTLTGTGFSAATAVQFGGVDAASFSIASDTSISVTTPVTTAGTVDVTVVSPGGTSAISSSSQFTFVGTPVVTGITPDHGPVTGGTDVEITGSGFTGATSVSFGDATAPFIVNSDTSISATTPGVDAAEPRDVVVAGIGGTSAPNPAAVFTFGAVGCTGPCVSVGDASVLEGDAGTRIISVPVTLSQPPAANVTVHYALSGVTATGGSAAGNGHDFKLGSGTLTFAPGTATAVRQFVSVTVYGDTAVEGDETLAITLTNPTGGFVLGRDVGTATVLDDDGIVAGPTAGIGDASIVQITGGAATLKLPVTLSSPASGVVTIGYVVIPGSASRTATAAGGGDYGGPVTGTIAFAAGSSARVLSIPIWANPGPSTDRSFVVALTGIAGGGVTLVRTAGTGTILAL